MIFIDFYISNNIFLLHNWCLPSYYFNKFQGTYHKSAELIPANTYLHCFALVLSIGSLESIYFRTISGFSHIYNITHYVPEWPLQRICGNLKLYKQKKFHFGLANLYIIVLLFRQITSVKWKIALTCTYLLVRTSQKWKLSLIKKPIKR